MSSLNIRNDKELLSQPSEVKVYKDYTPSKLTCYYCHIEQKDTLYWFKGDDNILKSWFPLIRTLSGGTIYGGVKVCEKCFYERYYVKEEFIHINSDFSNCVNVYLK